MLSRSSKLLLLVLVACSILAVGLQTSTISEEKRKQKDNQISEDLDAIHYKIESYQTSRSRLPKKLTDLKLTNSLKERAVKYTYKQNTSSYKLCATFFTDTSATESSIYADDYSTTDTVDTYKHGKGETCFTYKTYSDYYDDYNYDYDSSYQDSSYDTLGAGTTNVVADTERKSDIDALQSRLESYYAQHGYYPTLSDLNTASWVSLNMVGLEKNILTDPDSSSSTLVSSPQEARYSYEPLGTNGKTCSITEDCVGYSLTATLSSGKVYEATSM